MQTKFNRVVKSVRPLRLAINPTYQEGDHFIAVEAHIDELFQPLAGEIGCYYLVLPVLSARCTTACKVIIDKDYKFKKFLSIFRSNGDYGHVVEATVVKYSILPSNNDIKLVYQCPIISYDNMGLYDKYITHFVRASVGACALDMHFNKFESVIQAKGIVTVEIPVIRDYHGDLSNLFVLRSGYVRKGISLQTLITNKRTVLLILTNNSTKPIEIENSIVSFFPESILSGNLDKDCLPMLATFIAKDGHVTPIPIYKRDKIRKEKKLEEIISSYHF